jgi:hypothetical protein
MFFRVKAVRGYRYLQLVENRRDGRRTVQRVLATVGRMDDLQARGGFEALLGSLNRAGGKGHLAEGPTSPPFDSAVVRPTGPQLVLGKLCEAVRLPEILEGEPRWASHSLPLERALSLAVLRLLFGPSYGPTPGLGGREAGATVADAIGQGQLDRALLWLGWNQASVEDHLFRLSGARTSTQPLGFLDRLDVGYLGRRPGREGAAGPAAPGRMSLTVLRTAEGRPLACEFVRGGRADAGAPPALPVAPRRPFAPNRACWVTDLRTVGPEELDRLETEGGLYVAGGPLRDMPGPQPRAVTRPGRLARVTDGLRATEFLLDGRRHVLYRDLREAARDAADRKALLRDLQDYIYQGDAGFPCLYDYLDERFIGVERVPGFARVRLQIDRAKVAADARLDGAFLVRTNVTLPLAEVVDQYQRLRAARALFASFPAPSRDRPVFRGSENFARGQALCGFLALLLVNELERRLAAQGQALDWPQARRDVQALAEVEVSAGGRRYLLRTAPQGSAGAVLQALGIPPPRLCEEVPPR